jgi:hypothetical protein
MQENLIPKITEEAFVPNLVENEKWVGLFGYRAQDQRIILSKGQMYSVIVINGPQGFPAQLAGKYVWEAIVDKYYFSSKGKPLACLKEAMKAGKNRLVSVLKSDDVFKEQGVDITILTFVVWSEFIFFGIVGNPLFYLVRGERVIDIAGAFNDPNSKNLINVGSGKVEPNDFIVLGSSKLSDRFDDFLDDIQVENKGVTLQKIKKWFSREASLFDSDEGMYVLGFELDEVRLGVEEEPLEGALVEGAKAEEEIETSSEQAFPMVEAEDKTDSKSGLAGMFSSVALSVSGFAKQVGQKATVVGSTVMPKAKGLISSVSSKFSKVESADAPISISADEPSVSNNEILPEEHLEETAHGDAVPLADGAVEIPREIPEEEQTSLPEAALKSAESETSIDLPANITPPESASPVFEDIMIMGVPLTQQMINKMSFHEKVMYRKQIEEFEARESAQARAVSQNNETGQPYNSVKQPSSEIVPQTASGSGIKTAKFIEKVKSVVSEKSRALISTISQIKFLGGTKKYFVGKQPESLVKYLLIGLVILVAIVLIVTRVIEARKLSSLKDTYDSEIAAVDKKVSEGKELMETDPTKARTVLKTALASAKKTKKIDHPENKAGERVSTISKLIDQIEKNVSLSEENENFSIIMDAFVKFGEKAKISDMALYGDIIYLSDAANSSIYTFNITTKASGKISDSEDLLQSPSWIETSQTGNLFIYDKKQGMLKYSPDSGELKSLVGLTPRILGNITEMGVYGDNENLYFLSADSSKVYRSTIVGGGYSAPDKDYINFDGLTKATDLAIDANVFVSTQDAEKVYKFFSGKNDRFAITGLYDPLGTSAGLFIKQGFKDLYLLDSEKKRLVVLETPDNNRHKGQAVLVKQYFYRGKRSNVFNNLIEIVVDAEKTNAYILENNKIYQVILEK